MSEYFKRQGITIYNDDFLTIEIPDNSIDLIITSPPYNLDVRYGVYDDTISYSDYLEFTDKWLRKCYRLAKDDGRFCLNIPLTNNKGGRQSIYSDIVSIAKQIGWKFDTAIIWNKRSITSRKAWGSWMSAYAPHVITPVEIIAVLYKKQWKKERKGESDITRDEFIAWTNGLWTFNSESRKKIKHPAPFPVTLPKRCIKLFSYVDDIILDPFLGSGSTLIACIETNRRGIGVEIDPEYCKIAKQRIARKYGQCRLSDYFRL